MDVLMAAPVDTDVIPIPLRLLWPGNKTLIDLSVIFIPGNQFVGFIWPITTISQKNDLKP